MIDTIIALSYNTVNRTPWERGFIMKYEEKRAQIRAYLESTSFPGKRLPSERELAARFDINLGMVREILRELETLSIIRKKKRQGNFLNSSVLRTHARVDDNCSFFALIEDQGYELSEKKKIRTEHLFLDHEACLFLGDYARKDLLCFEEIYYADGHPAILSYYYCPKLIFGPVDWDAIQEDTQALKDYIFSIYPHFGHAVIHLFPDTANPPVSQALELAPGTSLTLWKEAYYNQEDELTGLSFNYLHPSYIHPAFVRKCTTPRKE